MARLSLNMRGSYGSDAGLNVDGTGNRGDNPYNPTVTMLLLMVLAEFAIITLLRFGFRHSHGG